MRWLIPSIADFLFLALLGVLAYSKLSLRLLGDAGIGWHIRTGQLILSTHAIPRADPFSSSMAGQPWFAWEWLYDLLVGWLDRAAGLNAVVLLTALAVTLTFSWAFRLLLRRGVNFLVALGLVMLSESASTIHLLARPHVVSWLFSGVWFWILDSYENQSCSLVEARHHYRRLWLLPLLMVVWVNVHGGFVLGLALLGIYWLSAVWRWLRAGEDRLEDVLEKIRAGRDARRLAFIGILSTLATLVNPYGWKLHLHVYSYLSSHFLMDHIDEFQSPNFHGIGEKCFAVLLLLTLIALAVRRRGAGAVHASEALVVLFAVYSGLYASRNIPVSSLLMILVIGPWLSNALQTKQTFLKRGNAAEAQRLAESSFIQRMQAIDSSIRGHLWPIAATVLTCWIVFHGGKLGSRQLMNAHFDPARFPVAAVDYMEKSSVPGPVFAPDSWGGYLIFRLYPSVKMVLDDRHDFYGEEFLKSYLKTIHIEPGWEDFLLQHKVRCAVVPKNSALASILLETPRWQAIYADDVAVIFVPARAAVAP